MKIISLIIIEFFLFSMLELNLCFSQDLTSSVSTLAVKTVMTDPLLNQANKTLADKTKLEKIEKKQSGIRNAVKKNYISYIPYTIIIIGTIITLLCLIPLIICAIYNIPLGMYLLIPIIIMSISTSISLISLLYIFTKSEILIIISKYKKYYNKNKNFLEISKKFKTKQYKFRFPKLSNTFDLNLALEYAKYPEKLNYIQILEILNSKNNLKEWLKTNKNYKNYEKSLEKTEYDNVKEIYKLLKNILNKFVINEKKITKQFTNEITDLKYGTNILIFITTLIFLTSVILSIASIIIYVFIPISLIPTIIISLIIAIAIIIAIIIMSYIIISLYTNLSSINKKTGHIFYLTQKLELQTSTPSENKSQQNILEKTKINNKLQEHSENFMNKSIIEFNSISKLAFILICAGIFIFFITAVIFGIFFNSIIALNLYMILIVAFAILSISLIIMGLIISFTELDIFKYIIEYLKFNNCLLFFKTNKNKLVVPAKVSANMEIFSKLFDQPKWIYSNSKGRFIDEQGNILTEKELVNCNLKCNTLQKRC